MPSPSRVYLLLPPARNGGGSALFVHLCCVRVEARSIFYVGGGRDREYRRVAMWRYAHRYAKRNPFTHDRSRASPPGMKVCQERGTRCLACPPSPTVCSHGFVQATCFPFERADHRRAFWLSLFGMVMSRRIETIVLEIELILKQMMMEKRGGDWIKLRVFLGDGFWDWKLDTNLHRSFSIPDVIDIWFRFDRYLIRVSTWWW